MANFSEDLTWMVVRDTSSFLRKGRFPSATFSCERGNLSGKNSFKFSGLANKRTVDVQPGDGSSLKLTTTAKDFDAVARKPKAMRKTKVLSKSMTAVAKAVSIATADTFYRPDMKRAALAKACTLKEAAKRKAAGVTKGKPARKKWAWGK